MNKIQYNYIAIKDIGKVVTGKTPATARAEYYNGPYMFISPTELHGGYNITNSEKTITEKGMESIKTNSIDGTSVLVGCIGWDMGNVAMCFEKCATNQQINSITNFKELYNPFYVYYWLSTKKEYLFSIASVTRTPILSKGTFEEVLIPMPEKKIQDNIVKILISIDKKIEINNKINESLREQVTLLYDYWFSQYDFPNKDGKPYRYSGGNMVFNDSLKCEIPVGWESKPISEIVSENTRGITPVYNENRNIPVINQKCIKNSNIIFDEVYWHDSRSKYSENLQLQFMDTLINSMGTGTLGRISPYLLPDVAVPHSCVTLLRSKEGLSLPCWLYCSIKKLEPVITRKGLGSTGQTSLDNTELGTINIVYPPQHLMEKFETIAMPIFKQIMNSNIENRELVKLREWLLPMLINGQATVLSC